MGLLGTNDFCNDSVWIQYSIKNSFKKSAKKIEKICKIISEISVNLGSVIQHGSCSPVTGFIGKFENSSSLPKGKTVRMSLLDVADYIYLVVAPSSVLWYNLSWKLKTFIPSPILQISTSSSQTKLQHITLYNVRLYIEKCAF